MPKVTYTHSIVDGSPVSADEISKSIYNHDNTTGDSLAVYNGGIDVTNLDGSFSVTRDMVRKNTYTGDVKMSAGNTNLDYHATAWFNDVSVDPASDLHWDQLFVPVPGLSASWENKRAATKLLFFWNFTAICGNNLTNGDGDPWDKKGGGNNNRSLNRGFRFVLNINGHVVDELDWRGPESNSSMVALDYTPTIGSSDSPDIIGHYYNAEALAPDLRHFSGWVVVDSTFLSELGTKDTDVFHSKTGGGAVAGWLNPLTSGASPRTVGWHNAGIDVVMHSDEFNRIRIMSRRFGVVPFYW